MDSPWHRLPWTLPTALLIWAVALCGLAYFMGKPAHGSAELSPIDAQLIEQSAPAEKQSIHPGRPAAVRQPKPLPAVKPQQAPLMPQVSPRTEQNPPAQQAEVTANTAAPAGAHAVPSEEQATAAVNTSANSATQVGSNDGKSSTRGSIFGNSGARAIIRPLPQIPDDLREVAFNSTALARFHIAVNGSVTVELAKPTPNPRLNRILLDSLKKWRFIPAIKNGQPVASTEDIIVKIEVK